MEHILHIYSSEFLEVLVSSLAHDFWILIMFDLFTFAAILLGFRIFILMEAIVTLTGSVCFMCAAFISMANVEKDMHMMYLLDSEEEEHYFFRINRIQSFFSLIASFIFLMHGTFCIDLFFIRPDIQNQAPRRIIDR